MFSANFDSHFLQDKLNSNEMRIEIRTMRTRVHHIRVGVRIGQISQQLFSFFSSVIIIFFY